MGCDTCGKIKGYTSHEEIFDFIKQKYDKNAVNEVSKRIYRPLSECDWEYDINEHSEDNENWYSYYGFIYFKYNDESRALFYMYDNTNCHENWQYYTELGLKDMVEAETTHIMLRCWGDSVKIIKEIVENFGGGWIDENDCDGDTYYCLETKHCTENISKVEVTADEKVRAALWNFECAMGIRPNRITMGCNLSDELRRMYMCNAPSAKVVYEYEGIPVTIDYQKPNILEVGYAMKLWD